MNLVLSDRKTVTTLNLREFINEERRLAGEAVARNDQFLARVEDEIDDLPGCNFTAPAPSGAPAMKYYNLTLEQATLVGMRESKAVRRAVLQKLKELEGQQLPALPNFSDPVAAARAWADAKEAEQEAVAKLEAAKPAIEFADRHAGANNLLSIRATAKALKFSDGLFIAAMIRGGLLYREKSTGNLMPYADKQHGGLFDVITGEANGHAYLQTKVTALGVQKLAARYSSELSQ